MVVPVLHKQWSWLCQTPVTVVEKRRSIRPVPVKLAAIDSGGTTANVSSSTIYHGGMEVGPRLYISQARDGDSQLKDETVTRPY